jgi:hypothetical protein
VQREISAILGKGKVVLRETERAVTPYGGVAVLAEYLKKIGYAEQVREAMPIETKSPNAIPPVDIYTGFWLSVLAGGRRFAHASLLRRDRGLHALLGINRFPTDDTVRNFFKKFTQRLVYEFYSVMWRWQIARVPQRADGYSLDLASTVFERYGRQQGALKGHNPRKHGRPSHHPLLAVLAEVHFVLHGWLRSGNCGTARGVVEFLKEALAQLNGSQRIRVVRADSGFFDEKLLGFLEQRELPYIIVARMTSWLKRAAARVREWRELDENYAVGEFQMSLSTWNKQRRFVVVRERIREPKGTVGRKLIDVPGYTFRLFVTNRSEPPEDLWRDYNQRASMENRIAELKYDLAADDFCLHEFFATEAAFLSILMLFNLLGEMQRMSGMKQYRRPATLRAQVFLCGAILGRSGHRQVLHLSKDWGGLGMRNSLMNEILAYAFPTSPKLISTA